MADKIPVFLIVCLMSLFSAAQPGLAADLYVKPQARSAPPSSAQSSQDELKAFLDQKNAPDQGQRSAPRDINEFANAYYNNCLKKQHPLLDADSQEDLCACTAANIPQTMSVENMKAMQNADDEGRLQRSRMLMFVYTPCIEYPTRSLILNQCLNNPDVAGKIKNYQQICSCLGDGMAEFMRDEAPRFIENEIRKNPDSVDPLGYMMRTPLYQNRSEYYLRQCIRKYVYGN